MHGATPGVKSVHRHADVLCYSYMQVSCCGCMVSYAEFILHHYAKLFMTTGLSFGYHQHIGCVTRFFLFAACVYVDNDVIVIHAVINGMRGYV